MSKAVKGADGRGGSCEWFGQEIIPSCGVGMGQTLDWQLCFSGVVCWALPYDLSCRDRELEVDRVRL